MINPKLPGTRCAPPSRRPHRPGQPRDVQQVEGADPRVLGPPGAAAAAASALTHTLTPPTTCRSIPAPPPSHLLPSRLAPASTHLCRCLCGGFTNL